jgi:hypothetical protein
MQALVWIAHATRISDGRALLKATLTIPSNQQADFLKLLTSSQLDILQRSANEEHAIEAGRQSWSMRSASGRSAVPAYPSSREIELQGVISTLASLRPTGSDITAIFQEIREYYSGQLKSSNKAYASGSAVGDGKIARRNHNMSIVNRQHTAEVASGYRFFLPPLESGKDLFNRNVRSGNCWEMCHVSAYLTNRKFPAARVTRANLFLPGDHYLIIVGDIPKRGPISLWRNQVMSSSSSVIDIWMGISCDTKDYPDRAMQKLNKWGQDGKLISTRSGWVIANDARYVDVFFASEVRYVDCVTNSQIQPSC